MKFLVLTVLVFAVAAQARDWSKIRPNNIYVIPQKPAPFLPKIVGGQEATPHQFAHQVALFIDGFNFCGGSIIHANVILTAAHCVVDAESVEVVAGAHRIKENEASRQSIVSTEFIVHEDFDRSVLLNDIALVILPEDIQLGDTAKIISLRKGECTETSLDGVEAIVSGWGRPSDSSISISPVLRFTSDKLIANSACKKYYRNIVKDSHICLSGRNHRGSCSGDSGGPMIVNNEEVGIVSFGSGFGCEFVFPSGFTRVTCFTDWIEAHLP